MADTTATFYPVGVNGTVGSTWSAVGGFVNAVSDPDDPLGDANTYISSGSGSTNFSGDPGRIAYQITRANSWGNGPYVWDNTKTWTLTIRYRVRNVFGTSTPDIDIWLKNPATDDSTTNRVHQIVDRWQPTSTAWAEASWSWTRTTHSPPASNPKSLQDMWDLGITIERQGGGNTEYTVDITWIKLEIVHPDAPPNDQWGTGRIPNSTETNQWDNWVPSTDDFHETFGEQRPADDDTSYALAQSNDGDTDMLARGVLSGTKGDEEWIMARWKRGGSVDPFYIRVATLDKTTGDNIFPAEDGDHWYVFRAGCTTSTDWVETWLRLANADKSDVSQGDTQWEMEAKTPTPLLPDVRLTQVIWTTTGTNNQTVTPEVAGATFIVPETNVKQDGDGSDDDGEQDPPGVTESEPPWLYAEPHANVHDQVGHLDLAGFPDLINRAPKWVWRAIKRLHDDVYRERELIGDSSARFGMPLEGQVVFDGTSSVSGTPSDHPIAAATAGGAVATAHGGLVYVIGPQTGAGFGYHYVYDPSDDSWTALAPVPDAAPGNGFYATIGDRLHFLSTGSDNISRHFAYTPATDSWDTTAFTPAPIKRKQFAATLVDGRIYIFGGITVPDDVITAVSECWDSRDDSWTRIADMPKGPRQNPAASAWGRFAYVFGGFGPIDAQNTHKVVSDAVRYDTERDTWSILTDITYGSTAVTRRAAFVQTLNGKLYVCGGLPQGGTAVATVAIYDPVRDTWSDGPTMPRTNSGGASAVAQGSIYVMRGTTGITPRKTNDRLVGAVPAYQATSTHFAAPALADGDADQTNTILNTTTGANGGGLAISPGDDVAIRIDDASIDWNVALTAYATIIGRGGRVDG